MIYTVAEKESTDKLLAERAEAKQRLFKEGMTGGRNNRGGAVWATIQEAQWWIDAQAKEQAPAVNGLAVYGVEGDWERDCVQYSHEPFRRLIISRPMAALPEGLE